MAESIEEQKHQQKLKDVALVPVYKHIQIPSSILRIALESPQPKVIYKVCLEVLKKQSFFNAFILTADVHVIYMQQFWFTITQELSTQKFYLQLDNQVTKVNADLIYNALNSLQDSLIIRRASGYDRPRLPMLQIL
ncbi:hypothetical protein Tco_0740243 [Tanacetum coccineum]